MNSRRPTLLLLLAIAAPAFGAELSPACKPIMDAMEKTLLSDHTTTTTRAEGSVNGITAGGTMYIQVKGAWRKSAMSAKDALANSRENLKAAKEFTCTPLADSVIDGTPVANYATHEVNEDGGNDGKVSIAKSSGMVLQVENDLKGGAGTHYVTHYGFGSVKAPM